MQLKWQKKFEIDWIGLDWIFRFPLLLIEGKIACCYIETIEGVYYSKARTQFQVFKLKSRYFRILKSLQIQRRTI